MKSSPLLILLPALAIASGTAPAAQSGVPLIRLAKQPLSSSAGSDTFGTRAIAVVQLDFTGTREIVHLSGSTLEIFFNPRRGPTISSTVRYTVDANPRGLVTADFDDDRDRDFAVLGSDGEQIEFLFGDGRGGFPRRSAIASGPQPESLVSADFDGDGVADLAYAYNQDDDHYAVRALLNRGAGRFEAIDSTVAPFVTAMIASDLDGDGTPDLTVTHFGDIVTVLLNNGAGGWQPPSTYRVAGRPVDIVAADLTGDGVRDLVTANFDSRTVAVLHGTGTGAFDRPHYFPMERSFTGRLTPTRLAVGDLTGDDIPDVMLANGSLLAARGDGSLAEPLQFDISAGTLVLNDLDSDGRLDVVFDNDFTSTPEVTLAFNRALAANRRPTPLALDDVTVAFGEDAFLDARWAVDPDGHLVTYEWRDELGRIAGTLPTEFVRRMPGRYLYALHLRDSWDGQTVVHLTLTVTGTAPVRSEIVLHAARAATVQGAWRLEADSAAASGARLRHPDAGAPRPATALADPDNYFELTFRANPNRVYTLSMRARADGNAWRNDSVFVQFTGTVGFDNERRWRIGTTDALVYSLERCVNCGMAGWGWNFDGSPGQNIGEPIRFANDQWQTIRIQTREDGLAIDQIVLSSWTYQGGRYPGSDRRDTVVLQRTQ